MSNNKFKVLIVEDEANICSFIETLLSVMCLPHTGQHCIC